MNFTLLNIICWVVVLFIWNANLRKARQGLGYFKTSLFMVVMCIAMIVLQLALYLEEEP